MDDFRPFPDVEFCRFLSNLRGESFQNRVQKVLAWGWLAGLAGQIANYF